MTAIVLDQVNERKRRFLILATAAAGGAAAGAVAVPFVASWFPSAKALAAGAPVEVDISKIEAGQQVTVEWRGKPVWVMRRTPEMLAQLDKNASLLADPESKSSKQPTYVKGVARSIKPEIFVAVGICTHLGCSPTLKKEVGAASTWAATGRAATTARATTLVSTLPPVCSRARPPPPTSRSRRTAT